MTNKRVVYPIVSYPPVGRDGSIIRVYEHYIERITGKMMTDAKYFDLYQLFYALALEALYQLGPATVGRSRDWTITALIYEEWGKR